MNVYEVFAFKGLMQTCSNSNLSVVNFHSKFISAEKQFQILNTHSDVFYFRSGSEQKLKNWIQIVWFGVDFFS